MRLWVINKNWVLLGLVTLAALSSLFFLKTEPMQTVANPTKEYVINMVTGEFKTTTEDGREIESYRWDPGTITIPKDEKVKLSIFGVNGKEHPFIIEGTDIQGTVKKGEETVIDLHFTEAGVYRLICVTHASTDDNGPMIAYIHVN
ncbi:cupredoxin domain-containing protein [Alkalihalobacillus sp. LMS39]|uniref:cupredoxin domain-containing protein n=1 Tax=Alkalihalobacillus sp. LMS39 TaxID=2924032 RepID=UPI001FB30DA8|nr:cupredoxin domain-containing protein [Alkalihalobacillus sp. LMS39]UOE92010.1 cupredoxin domain-containing protein [Alkalihalobacillus sp. LMS39]